MQRELGAVHWACASADRFRCARATHNTPSSAIYRHRQELMLKIDYRLTANSVYEIARQSKTGTTESYLLNRHCRD